MYRDTMAYQRHLHATHLGCRTLTLQYAPPIALTDCDTPSMSHMHFAPPLPCLKRYRQCDRRFATQPSCRTLMLRHSSHVAASCCDTPCVSHTRFATLGSCHLRQLECLKWHWRKPEPTPEWPFVARNVPKLALLCLVILSLKPLKILTSVVFFTTKPPPHGKHF